MGKGNRNNKMSQVAVEPPPEEEVAPKAMKTAAQKRQEKKLRDKEKRREARTDKPQEIPEEPIPEEPQEKPTEITENVEKSQQSNKTKKRNAMAAKIREAMLLQEKEQQRLKEEEEARKLREEEEARIRAEEEERARLALEEQKRKEKELRKKQIAEDKLANSKLSRDRHKIQQLLQGRGLDSSRLAGLPGVSDKNNLPVLQKVVLPQEPVLDEEEEVKEEEIPQIFKGDPDLPPEKRIPARREYNKQNRSLDDLRAPVVCVLGHVDTGKTKILDKLRQTNVQDGEAGGITQQIGATNVPMAEITKKTSMVEGMNISDLKFPGLLIIDTPGHESFSNLRSRGSSLCDIAILVVDIMHGLEKQTIESIRLLINGRTPFVVALNKVDRLIKWRSDPGKDIRRVLESQSMNVKLDFESRFKEIMGQFTVQGLNVALFYENDDMNNCASVVPTSAVTGDGMGNLVGLVCQICQDKLAKRLRYSEEIDATVMEVKTITGLGTTVDVILVNGRLSEGDTIVIAGQDGPVVTSIRAILTPPPMKELRVKSNYIHHKSLKGARGMKLTGKSLEGTIAGLPLFVAYHDDEVNICSKQVSNCLKSALNSIHLSEQGVYVQASTLGSLEALLEFLRTQEIPYCGINVGPVHKRDVVQASVMMEKAKKWAVILAFDVPVDRAAQELADIQGVKIFTADIIYHLCDKLVAYIEQEKTRVKNLYRSRAIFPCRLKIIPEHIIKTRDPIIIGVRVESGIVCVGTPICLENGVFLGHIVSIESNNTSVDNAKKGSDVAVKIMYNGTEGKKMYGRHFNENDPLLSQLTRDSIDVLKEYFRDELSKNDWKLIVELKGIFGIV